MTESNYSSNASDIRDVIGPVWRRKWLLLLIIALSTVGTYLISARAHKRYQASTHVLVSNSQIQAILNPSAPSAGGPTQDQAQLLLSRPVAQAVIAVLGLRDTPQALISTVSATPATGSNDVLVIATRASPREAAAVANAFVDRYIAYRAGQLASEIQSSLQRVRRQISGLPRGPVAAQQRQDLLSTVRQLQAAGALGQSQAIQTDRAIPPTHPFAPRPKRDAIFALVISLALGLALAFTLERFDRRIKRLEDVAGIYGVPLLTAVPHTGDTGAVTDGNPVVPENLREPFRSLQTTLQLASLDERLGCVTVTSAVPGEGKSTIVRNLALTYREWGLNVAVVECDCRRPTLSRFFGFEQSSVGLTSVLTGDVALDDALLDVEVDTAALAYLDKIRETGNGASGRAGEPVRETRLALLPSGPTPPNPEAVLASDKTRRLIAQLRERFDIVLIDTPPLLAVSDGIPLLAQSDGVIVVTRIGLTERSSAQRLMETAGRVPGVRILGAVANDLRPEPGGGYGYAYGTGYGYRAKVQS